MRTFRRGVLALLLCSLLLPSCAPASGLVFLCSNEESVCEQWREDFAAQEGVSAQFLRLPTSEALARISSSKGRPEFDAWVGGPSDSYVVAARRGLLEPYTPQHWDSIPTPFKDEAGNWFGVYGSVLALCSNPRVLKEQGLAQPSSWVDLEDEAYRSWISASSPLTSGTAFTALWTQAQIFGDEAPTHLRKVYSNVQRFTHSGAAPADIVASGKAAVAISFEPYCFKHNQQPGDRDQGDQLTIVFPSEGTFYEVGAAALLNGSRNPRSAKQFLDWLSGAPGQLSTTRSGVPQKPISTELAGNLEEFLHTTDVRVIDADATAIAKDREKWTKWTLDEIEFSK
ncbi:MAG: ABC transporter substrate-binding protein [Actinomycetaceae bacterium]|nr:ABC transporter substrate-binding protein [Actinomycetaceae bacterium]